MKQLYASPKFIEYGRVGQLTLGVNGSVPDLDANLNNVNNTCPQEELGGGVKTVACVVVSA